MSKNDIGAMLAGLFTVLASIGVYARDFLGRGLAYIWGTFVALIKLKAAWAAVGLCMVLGFWVGHIEGSAGKRALRAEVVTLKSRASASSAAAAAAVARAVAATNEAKSRAEEVEALTAELAAVKAGAPRGASAPVAGVPRKPATKPVPKKTPVSAPAKPFWPWE